MDFDVLCVGNALIDAFLGIHNANIRCVSNQKFQELCVPLGEKILVDSCLFDLGGGACNISVGVSRLGHKVAIFSEIGNDDFANRIINGLKEESVNTKHLTKTSGNSSFSMILQFNSERTIFTNQKTREHDFRFEEVSSRYVFLCGIGHEWKHAYGRVTAFVKKTGAKLAFNPGPIQLEEGKESIREVLEATDILFLNREEAQQLLIHEIDNIKELLSHLQKLGPKTVVVTDAEKGSYVLDRGGKVWQIGKFPVEVVEKTGAGNAYASGFLSAILLGLNISEAMRFGAINASSVIEYVGSQPGLLHSEEIKKRLKENPEFRAKEI